eukprot:228668-Lingulodinium_polyedra.AAC.1
MHLVGKKRSLRNQTRAFSCMFGAGGKMWPCVVLCIAYTRGPGVGTGLFRTQKSHYRTYQPDEEGKPLPWEELYDRLGVSRSSDNSGPLVFSANFIKVHASRTAESVTATI